MHELQKRLNTQTESESAIEQKAIYDALGIDDTQLPERMIAVQDKD